MYWLAAGIKVFSVITKVLQLPHGMGDVLGGCGSYSDFRLKQGTAVT
jgi:hypothetical protein